MSTEVCLLARDRHVAHITLNRPDRANALSRALVTQLAAHIDAVEQDPEVRVLIVTGAGGRVFCAGADLKERKEMAPEEVPVFLATARALLERLAALRCPTIAALNGGAYGGGLELAMACDLRIAAADVTMGLTETSLAIIPGAGGTQRLPRLVGVARAKELIMTARRIDTATALQMGLVNEVAERENLEEATGRLAASIAANGPIAVTQAKRAIDGGIELPLTEALAWEQECYAPVLETEDRLEALRAFAEKRAPVFKGN